MGCAATGFCLARTMGGTWQGEVEREAAGAEARREQMRAGRLVGLGWKWRKKLTASTVSMDAGQVHE